MSSSVALDLKVYRADERITRNILAIRTAYTTEDPIVEEKTVTVLAGQSLSLENLPNTFTLVLQCARPISVSAKISGSSTDTIFSNQRLLVITDNCQDIFVENNNSDNVVVSIIRLARNVVTQPDPIPRQLITFGPMQRITALPQAITDISKVIVQDVTLATFTNDQVTPPGTGISVIEKFRICDSDGTPNVNGAYIMYLDDNITQQNFSGTLQLWVEETN